METVVVGRKKTKSPDPARKPIVINIKGDPEWGTWVEKLAEHNRMSVAGLVDQALVLMAKASKFDDKPPKR